MSVQFVCRCRRFLSIACAFAALVVLCGHSKTLFARATITTVMSGLDNPRGLAFAPDGGLYVVEAGRGGEQHYQHEYHRKRDHGDQRRQC